MAPFTYIHVPGCNCSSAPDYQAQLAAARAEAKGVWSSPEERVPEGSCVGWILPAHRGQGWPADHRDYQLLALHAEVVRCRAVLAATKATHEGMTIRDGWNPTEAERAEEGAAFDAWMAAQTAERAAADTLEEALGATSHGAQPDGSFVTRHTIYSIASGRYCTTLHAPAKQGPIAELVDPQQGHGAAELRVVRTREEARAVMKEARAKSREDAKRYEADRREAGAVLANGFKLVFFAGQNGGKVRLEYPNLVGVPRRMVSARGALRAAGMTKEGAQALLDAAEGSGLLSLHGVTVTAPERSW